MVYYYHHTLSLESIFNLMALFLSTHPDSWTSEAEFGLYRENFARWVISLLLCQTNTNTNQGLTIEKTASVNTNTGAVHFT